MFVRELELDLDAFEGPFDLLLTLVLREEIDLSEVDVAGIIVAFIERLAEREELDLEACGEFLVLVAALLELKARALFPEEDAELSELEPYRTMRRTVEHRRQGIFVAEGEKVVRRLLLRSIQEESSSKMRLCRRMRRLFSLRLHRMIS